MSDALIDTNVIIDLLNNIPQAVNWHQQQANLILAITPVIWFETLEGANNNFERSQALKLLRRFQMEHPTISNNNWAMAQYSQFYLSHGVDWEDCMIASVTVRLAIPLYTRNSRHFTVLPALDLRQPY
ncbi:MAG: PIN domain-containing protein [Chloroflexi bacterium]|nr:PIN domain-containing protein [Chloroflexota bacterium]MCC6896709.1 PIN domain-containing protein [Anaerolineae bacterium]